MIRKYVLFTSPILLLLAIVVTMFAAMHQVSAISKVGLDPDEFGGGEARYALEDTSDVEGARYAYVPVYYLDVAGTANAKPPDDMELKIFDFGNRSDKSMSVNVGGRISDGNTIGGTTSDRFNKDDGEFAFTIPKANFTYRKDLKAWEASFITRMAPGEGRVQYRVQITNPSGGGSTTRGYTGKIGYSADNGQNFAVANRSRCDSLGADACGRYYNYTIPFGTPCSVKGQTAKFVKIYDGDNTKSATDVGIQGKDEKFSVKIYDLTDKKNVGGDMRSGSGDGNNETAYYDFQVEPQHKYELRINNVYTNNVLQFQLPYDSIESIADCGYNVTPSVTLGDTTAEPSVGTVTGAYYTTNPGPGVSAENPWQLTRCVMPAGNTAYSSAIINNTTTGVTTYRGLGGTCDTLSAGADPRSFPVSSSAKKVDDIPPEPMPALQPGQRLCFIFSVRHPRDNSADDAWRHSVPACILIGKKPKVQILGNDIFVGRLAATATGTAPAAAIQTSVSQGTSAYGSWVEYMASATGTITGLGSGSGFAGGSTSYSSQCSVSNLTLSNTTRYPSTSPPIVAAPAACNSSTTYGAYNTKKTMPNVSGYFTTAGAQGLSGNVDITNLSGTYTAGATLNITGGDISPGRSIIINAPNTDVTISGNINYSSGAFKTIAEIPQVVIIAKNIFINGRNDDASAVTNIDSWLIAGSTINTCNDLGAFTNITTDLCKRPLTVNGPVMANTLLLRRTGGSEGSSMGVAAEVFNLRPDAYLWGIAQAAKSGRLQTTYETELPPRY